MMREFAELVKAIRYCSTHALCDDCPRAGWCTSHSNAINIGAEAADAIEELLNRDVVPMDFHERCLELEVHKRIEIEKQMPRWISVEEQPIPHDWVWGVYRQTICGKVMQHHKTVRMYGDNIVDQEGNIYNGFITHWMPRFPLPAPPKEVE